MYHIENLFPTPIYSCSIENKDDIQLEIADILENLNYEDSYNYNKSDKNFETTDPTIDIINQKQLTNTGQTIHYHLEQYCKELGFNLRDYKRISWIVKTSKGGNTMSHTHGEYDIAGVYYFKTNEQDGEIYFESPVGPAVSSLCFQKYSERYSHSPAIGKLILFPGWLAHGVKTNNTDSERISLAFSIAFSR